MIECLMILWMEVRDIVQETGIKTIPMEKKCKKAKWLSEEALKIAVKRREVKSKGEKGVNKIKLPMEKEVLPNVTLFHANFYHPFLTGEANGYHLFQGRSKNFSLMPIEELIWFFFLILPNP